MKHRNATDLLRLQHAQLRGGSEEGEFVWAPGASGALPNRRARRASQAMARKHQKQK